MHQRVTVPYRKRRAEIDSAQYRFIVEQLHEHRAETFKLWFSLPVHGSHGIVCSVYIKGGKLLLSQSKKI